jgi:outer membrane protein TolC
MPAARHTRASVLALLVLMAAPEGAALGAPVSPPLPLAEAEQRALEIDPVISRFQSQSLALQERAVAEAQLPDPTVRLGYMREDMREAQVGVMQMFPRGRTRALRGERTRALASAEDARAADQALRVLRAVRTSWLEAYYQARAGDVIRESRELFAQLVAVTEQQYAAGRGDLQDVLRAQLELSLLDDRSTRAQAGEDAARAELGRWIGHQEAARPLPGELPALPTVADKTRTLEELADHPVLQVEEAMLAASDREVDLARQLYRPGWALDLTYGRILDEPMDARQNTWSVMVQFDLPIFTSKRQDRQFAASQQQAAAARYGRAERLRDLQSAVESEHAAWQRLGERFELYERELLPQSGQTAQAALQAYQARATEFSMLMRAYLNELENRLQALRVQVDRARVQANLLYFSEE